MCSNYKIIVILALVVTSLTSQQQANALQNEFESAPTDPCTSYKDYLSTLILKFLNNLKSHMSEGLPDIGVPPLDPLAVPNETVYLKKLYEYDLKGEITNSTLLNLKTFNVTKITTSIFHMRADITLDIPFLLLTGTYSLKGKTLQIIPIKGNGRYFIKPENIKTSITTTMTISDRHLQMKSIDFDLQIGGLTAKFEGLFGGGRVGSIANSLMNRFGLGVFRRIEPKVHERVRDALLVEVNAVLKDLPLSQLIGSETESTQCSDLTDILNL